MKTLLKQKNTFVNIFEELHTNSTKQFLQQIEISALTLYLVLFI